jgi:integrase
VGAFRLTNGARLGEKRIAAITEDDLEALIADLRLKGRAASTRNGYVQLLKASLRWAVKKGYLTRSPISDDGDIIKRSKIAQRNRRLAPAVVGTDGKVLAESEEQRLLAAAPPLLQRIIIAALETCCRCGELLALRWRDVNLDGRTLRIRAETAKDAEERILPISTRLAATLEMARTDPAGHDYPGAALVFGELGQPIRSIKKSWETTVLKAHGYTPVWKHGGLAPEARAHLRAIDLHFHDLRHEAASRLLEAGWPLHHVQEMLGHASLDQTTTYLNVKIVGLQESMRKLDDVRSRCNSVVNRPGTEHPRVHNGESEVGSKRLIN